MNNKAKFETFLESLKGNGQDSLIESIKQGFMVCFENGSSFTLNLRNVKDKVLAFIEEAKHGVPKETDLFYNIMTGKSTHTEGNDPASMFTAKEKEWWRDSFDQWGGNGPWAQLNFGENFVRKTGDEKTFNFYITIAKDKENVIKFRKGLNSLAKAVMQLSKDEKTTLSFKTHRTLSGFVPHNDSLKIYYYDADLKEKIVKLVEDWLSTNDIKKASRLVEHGIDRKVGGEKKSYGQLLAKEVEKYFTNWIKSTEAQAPKKYTNEQYYQQMANILAKVIRFVDSKMKKD